ncbi:hypothetical protein AYO47_04690 [Planctomyces sp. SCGC AG-212-M04]|nr:hypothetical protein AYO47_04690 [Planctomyces sp. SCGC AG-212-M04]
MSTGPFRDASEVTTKLMRSGTFHTEFEKKVNDDGSFGGMGVAVVDLTTGAPRYGTTGQEHVDKHVFSLAKLAPFFAAHYLRWRLRNEFKSDPAKTADALVATIEKAWKPAIAAKVQSRTANPDFPRLKKIFDLSSGPPWEFKFKERADTATKTDDENWEQLQKLDDKYHGEVPKKEIDPLPFLQRMRLMVRMSDNNAAGSVASDIGLAYMFGALAAEGLYTITGKNDGHGLWLSNTYGYDGKFMGVEGKGDDLTAGATAFAVAEYLTRLHQKVLVDTDGCNDMLDILKERSGTNIGTMSRFDNPSKRRVMFSKIGLWIGTNNASDGAIIESQGTTAAGTLKNVTYVAVALQDLGGSRMRKMVRLMEDHVKAANGLT